MRTLPFLQIFQWVFVRMHPVNGPANLKSAAVPVPRIIGGTLKLWTVWSPEGRVGVSRVWTLDTPTLPFLQNF